jgi:hypothetical protein
VCLRAHDAGLRGSSGTSPGLLGVGIGSITGIAGAQPLARRIDPGRSGSARDAMNRDQF